MTMTNAEWIIQNGYKFEDIRLTPLNDRVAVIDVNGKKDPLIIQTQGVLYSFMKWLDSEHKEPILDDAERRYLSAVIRPFRDRAVFVKKIYPVGSYEQIIMRVKSIATDTDIADIPFPFFNEGKMYKGMKLNKEYTLEELGLCD